MNVAREQAGFGQDNRRTDKSMTNGRVPNTSPAEFGPAAVE